MTLQRPHGRDLTREELRAVAASIGACPELWEGSVRHDRFQRVYEELVTDDYLAIWMICWSEGHDTGFHDHDGSAGAVSVMRGHLREERLRIGGPPSVVELGPGSAFDFESTDIHRVVNPGGEPAVSIHAYSPPLRGMGSYVIEPTGALRRHTLAKGTELRPLAPTTAASA
jgi:predicted metal-dependent enzyme (double-stranded beta helix superfamily)